MGASAEIGDKYLLLFDGVCNLCNGAINFVIDRDHQNQFVFASLQSPLGQELMTKYQLPKEDFKTMILIKEGTVHLRSNAALEVARSLQAAWPMLYAFKIVPRFIRDAIYNLISANRYKWFGKKNQCRIPTTELKSKFVSV